MQTSTLDIITPMPHSVSHSQTLALSMWILAARLLLRIKDKDVCKFNNEEKHTDSIVKDKWLKKKRGVFLRAGKEMLFVNWKVSSSQSQHIQSISAVLEHYPSVAWCDPITVQNSITQTSVQTNGLPLLRLAKVPCIILLIIIMTECTCIYSKAP